MQTRKKDKGLVNGGVSTGKNDKEKAFEAKGKKEHRTWDK